jgi:GNAT superfamily N-acetyltransferase
MTVQNKINYQAMSANDFNKVISLGTKVHGEGYIDQLTVKSWFEEGLYRDINPSFVAYDNNKLVGFRLTFAINQWSIDKWCSPEKWQHSPRDVCYFKCNTVDGNYRGFGIGSKLLTLSINAAKQQGAKAGVSHLWQQSPGNSAVKYFTKCGGQLITIHPDRWNELSKQGYICPVCGDNCHCQAAEMIIHF